MIKIKEIQANGFYVFQGRSNANSCFIEKLSHGKQFLIYSNYFLKGYLSIYDYLITRDGWILVVRVKKKLSESGIKKGAISKIISERVRLLLSTFVRVTNKDKGRTGSLVHSSYEKYCFETLKEAKAYIELIRNQNLKMYSRKKKYRSLKTHYKIPSSLGKGSIFLCSRDVRKKRFRNENLGGVFEFIDLRKLVLLKMIDFTNSSKNLTNSSFQSPFYQKNSS